MADDLNRAEFVASFPPIQSAILRTGNGDGLRIKLDVPETEMSEGVKLFGMVGARLRVTMEVIQDNGNTSTINRRAAKQRD